MKPIKNKPLPASPCQGRRYNFPLTRGIKGVGAFTLVELLVVITILAILGTIGFMSFNGYQSSARDSVRVSDMKNLETGLELSIVRTGTYPTPDDSVSYTGGTSSQIMQGYVGDNVSRSARMNKTPLDPLSSNRYVYSVSGDRKYYQLASSLENTTSYNSNQFIQQAIAADTTSFKTTKVIGNYKIDPSLPSLIVVPSSYNTSSGIFDPNVCFVMDRGVNALSTCTEKKKDMNLKDYDNSLVGYWDMETCSPNCTTSGAIVKDLVGSNSGIIFGTQVISTGSILGKGLNFIGDSSSYMKILKDTGSILNNEEITVNVVFKANLSSYWGEIIGDTHICGGTNRCSNLYIGTSPNTYNPSLLIFNSHSINILPYFGTNYTFDFDNKFISVYFVRKDGIGKIYLNGNKIFEKSYDRSLFYPNSSPFIIGAGSFSPASVKTYGIIDDIKIYNRALSDSEILQQAKIAGF